MAKTPAFSSKKFHFRDLLKQKKFLIIVSLPANDAKLANIAYENGADAIKVHINVHHKASGTRFGSWRDEKEKILKIIQSVSIPVGLMPGAEQTANGQEMREAIGAGIQFIDIYDHDMPVWMLKLPCVKMVAASPHFTLEGIRSLNDINFDCLEASIVKTEHYGKPLALKDLENYRSFVKICKKSVFVPSQKKLTPNDLKTLKNIGVKGVLLGAIVLGKTPESFTKNLPLFTKLTVPPLGVDGAL